MPSKTHNAILAQCSHIFAYNFNLQTQIEWLRDNFFGNEAWLLLSKDLRNKYYTDINSIDILPKFSYLYRKDTDSKTQIMIPNQGLVAPQAPEVPKIEESLNEENLEENSESKGTEVTETKVHDRSSRISNSNNQGK